MRKLFAIALMAVICCAAIYLASITGCSSQPTETQSTVMSLRDVQDEYGDELLARDSVQGITIDVYRLSTDSMATVVAAYHTTDSCVVFIVNADGTVQNVTKPLSEYTKCLINGIAVCNQWYDQNTQPIEHAQCTARVMVQCACWDTLFSWFYGKLVR